MKTMIAAVTAIAWAGIAAAQALTIPSPEEAKGAVIQMFNDPDLAKMLAAGHVVIGTCKPTTKPAHAGEIACTIAVVMGAGSSETQANFYRAAGKWAATPTSEDLPFPDPKLR
jgi:hypothetical protein